MIPMGGHKVAPNPQLVDTYPDTYLNTGLVAENHAREARVSREEQDAYALESHRRAIAAIDAGRFRDEIVPVPVRVVETAPALAGAASGFGGGAADFTAREFLFDVDEGPRRDTSLEALEKLRPAFLVNGTVTAGNSSQTSDGAAAVAPTRPRCARR